MAEERARILRMVADGKVTPEDAEGLLDALEPPAHPGSEVPVEGGGPADAVSRVAEVQRRVLGLLEDGRIDDRQSCEMLRALTPAAADAQLRVLGLLEDGRIEADRSMEILWALLGTVEVATPRMGAGGAAPVLPVPPAAPLPPGSAPSSGGGPSREAGSRRLRLDWHDASGKLIENVSVAAAVQDAISLVEMLPDKAVAFLNDIRVDVGRIAKQAEGLAPGTVVYKYDNDNAQGARFTVE